MGDQWDLVGGNPAPGDPGGVLAKERVFLSIANNATRCRDDLIALRNGNADFWQGEAADAFRTQLDHTASLPDDLRKLTDSYLTAAGALKRYGQTLDSLQDQARRALASAQTASKDAEGSEARLGAYESNRDAYQRDLDSHRGYLKKLRKLMREPAYSDRSNPANASWAADIDRRYTSTQSSVADCERNVADQQRNVDNESRSLDDARRRLQAAKDQIKGIRDTRDGLVSETVQQIEQASDEGIKNKSWLQKKIDYVKDHWVDILDNVSKILDTIGLALAIVGIAVAIVFTGGAAIPIIAAIAVGVAATKLAVDVVLVTQGRRNWGDLGWDAVDLLLSVTALRALKGPTRAALKGAGGGTAGRIMKVSDWLKKTVRMPEGATRFGSKLLRPVTSSSAGRWVAKELRPLVEMESPAKRLNRWMMRRLEQAGVKRTVIKDAVEPQVRDAEQFLVEGGKEIFLHYKQPLFDAARRAVRSDAR